MRILIIDDDGPFAHMLGESIEQLDSSFSTASATTADEARHMIERPDAQFDAFLIDHRLDGSNVDGISLMSELLESSRDSDAIIFTGYDDSDTKQKASRAGAYWYLGKPFQTWDLLHILRQLKQERRLRRERNRLQTLNAIVAEIQNAVTVQAVGRAIVGGVGRLGFRQARLRLFQEGDAVIADDRVMIGICQAGNKGLEKFNGLRQSLAKLPYSREAIAAGRPLFFHGRELGAGELEDEFADKGFQPPVGDWVKIPLFIGERAVGSLSLDNADEECDFDDTEKELLVQWFGLFGQQAAAALERARLHEHTERQAREVEQQAREAEILRDIGRVVTTQAAQGNLDALLETIREQIGKKLGLDISNFIAVLLNEETGHLDFRCHYERGVKERRHWREHPRGLVGQLIQSRMPLLLPNSLTKSYRERHRIDLYGTPSQCWLGVPLLVEDQVIGALVVQSYGDPHAYNEYHQRVLVAVADQVAGAVEAVYHSERDRERTRHLETLQRMAAELPRLARDDEDRFWHTILTVITHRDGLSLNRAVLFLYEDDGTRLRGRLGIGDINYEEARCAWERDEETGWSLEDYFKLPHLGRLAPTRLEETSREWEIRVGEEESPFRQVWATGERRIISAPEHMARWLPKELANPEGLTADSYPLTAALVPLKLDSRVLGVVVVDNAFDGEPLYPNILTNLEELLRQAAEALNLAQAFKRNQHQSESDRAILQLTQQVIARVRERPLKGSLEDIARKAKALSTADLVVIYPLQQDGGGYVTSDVAAVGLVNEEKFRATNKPRQQGVTGHILRAGTLVVPDIRRNDLTFDGGPLSNHPFLTREKIQAFIGVPVHESTTGKRLGVLYLDYRSPQHFSEPDVALAEDLAQAIAVVIRAERDAGGREVAEAAAWSRELELTLLRDIQEEALTPDTDERKVIKATLKKGVRLFELAALLRVGMLTWETADGYARPVWYEFFLDTLGRLSNHKASEAHRNIMGKALQTGEVQQNGRLFVVPVRLSKRVIGAIQIEFSDATHFTSELAQRAERLATAVALALDNVRRLGRFRAVLNAAKAVTAPSDLQTTLGAVVVAAQDAAPGIECVTIWYEDPITRKLLAGPQWGLIGDPNTQVQEGTPAREEGLVRRVIRANEPIWAEGIDVREGLLKGDFNRAQKIVSAAAFPLRVGTERVGALFFSYRQSHIFTPEERELFPIFAEIAAASLQDARRKQYAEQRQLEAERNRANLEAAARVSAAVGTSLDLPSVLESIVDELHNRFKLQGKDPIPYVMLYDPQAEALVFAPSAIKYYIIDNPDHRGLTQLPLKSNIKSISLQVAHKALRALKDRQKEIIIELVDDVKAEGFIHFRLDTRSELCAALVNEDRLLGVLVLKSSQVGAFTEVDKQLFKLIAEQVALAIDRAERAAKAKRDASVAGAMAWAADVAHDINPDIGYILDRVYWLRERELNLSDQGQGWVKEIDARAHQLAGTAQDATSTRSKPEEFALVQMLRNKIATWQPKTCPDVLIEVDGEDVEISAHREQVWRAVRQFLRNSIEAMQYKGSLLLLVSRYSSREAELLIKDTGPGIIEDVQQRLFREPFSTKNTKEEERGFGLLIAQWLIESMRGSIYLLPTLEDGGTTFVIRMPLTTENEQEAEHASHKR
jgi:GAF domain-containing protein/response regulator of citrate/malate metabolism